jgi:putative flippase GtrA
VAGDLDDLIGSSVRGPAAWRRSGWFAKLFRYAGSSVVATVCSEATLVLLYGPAGVDPGVATILAWLAGALPNYWLNRRWAWQRTGRPSLRHELLPYIGIILVTLALATLATKGADAWLQHADVRSDVRVALVAATFLGVYVVMFVLRFFLLDRLFTRVAERLDHHHHAHDGDRQHDHHDPQDHPHERRTDPTDEPTRGTA